MKKYFYILLFILLIPSTVFATGTELTITVRLLKTPIDQNANIESDTIITLVATPVQS